MWQQTHVIKICLSDLTAFNLAFLSRTFGRQKRITFNIANVTFYKISGQRILDRFFLE